MERKDYGCIILLEACLISNHVMCFYFLQWKKEREEEDEDQARDAECWMDAMLLLAKFKKPCLLLNVGTVTNEASRCYRNVLYEWYAV
ncbi:unnamed protein product [Lactuca saligna]|uniref:Uncharacterized protein n=1 Tax=Lactuca saligna TaxID=75948 RepID=A0AA35YGK0_LACSI|nr:unnamed protein product [Lactuca saligna]